MSALADGNAAGLREELAATLNRHSAENGSDTPDFILSAYLLDALQAFEKASRAREDWYGHRHAPAGDDGTPELRALAVRASTLLEAAAKADLAGVPLHPGAWHSEMTAWRERYLAYLEARATVPGG